MSRNTSHHFITAWYSSLKTAHINSLLPWNLCMVYLQKYNSVSENYRTLTYLLAKHHLNWDFATKSYCSFMKLSTWCMKSPLENLIVWVFSLWIIFLSFICYFIKITFCLHLHLRLHKHQSPQPTRIPMIWNPHLQHFGNSVRTLKPSHPVRHSVLIT